ncbi:lantibiotic dehydratase [Streptomyces spiroverticillatus]|uniref:Lantibiotic dehydratase n=1 Tax=Streptomyces finlayi TaxID=67296 RepID=A0A918WSM5_9ACTN|nr:lantibiotic dehydratase [Streptomyces spiroverticillatus]GHC78975.1 lantibiotic dehydratase [Streptomyces finlayi]
MFRCADGVLIRTPLLARRRARDTWRPAAPAELRPQLAELVADPLFREALEVSSPSLARTVEALLAEAPLTPSDLRKAHRAVTRYLLRAASRPTPFGLLAGVLWGSFGATTKGELTGGGHKAARLDAGLLARLVTAWERDPEIHRGLTVVANSLCFVRGDRLVLPFAPADPGPGPAPSGGNPPTSRTLRHTPVVQALREAAAGPVPCEELIRRTEGLFPTAPEGAVARLVGQLIGAGVLLTPLRPPLDAPDPLAHVASHLPADGPAARRTAELRATLDRYVRTPLGEGRDAWREVLETAGDTARDTGGHAVQVDLRLDGTVELSREVARELEHAATALWRLALPGRSRLVPYHQDFVERYGLGRHVPVKELLDPDIGLGAPAGYRLPPSHRPNPGPAPLGTVRQRLLLGLAAEAQARGAREVVLDEEMLRRLASADRGTHPDRDDAAAGGRPPALELVVQVAAASAADLDRGDFTLVLNGAATASGGLMGRFAHLFDPAQTESMRQTVRAAREDTGRLPVQVHHQASHHRHANVAQVPTWLDGRLVVGVHPGPAEPGVTDVGLDDLTVCADSEGFAIWSASLGRELTPSALHVLNRELTAPNAVRFLVEAAAFGHRQWQLWEWGAAEDLPFLPAVRVGRTVLAPARWRLEADGPPLDEWRGLWQVPDHVQLALGDHRIPLNLTVPAHREILRRECERKGVAVVHEPPRGQDPDGGWLHGPEGAHETEAVVTLTPLPRPSEQSVRPRRTPPPVVTRHGTGEIPPGGPWLYATLYASAERQDELLAGPLKRFLTALPTGPGGVDRWFFIRYADPDPHLRLRLHGDPALLNGVLLPQLHALAEELGSAGLARGLRLDSYSPETERYGGPALLSAAEEVFHADSRRVLDRLHTPADDRILSTAHDVAALTSAFHRGYGGDWRPWFTRVHPKRERHHKAFAARRKEALALLTATPDTYDGHEAAIERFGSLVRAAEGRGELSVSPDAVLASLLHMHCNRRLGTDRTAEAQTLAVVRGTVQAQLDRERAQARREGTPA